MNKINYQDIDFNELIKLNIESSEIKSEKLDMLVQKNI